MLTVMLSLWAKILLTGSSPDGLVTDPLVHFLDAAPAMHSRDFKPFDAVSAAYRMRVDFQGNGKEYVLLTAPQLNQGRGEYEWFVYKPVDGRYKPLGPLLVFPHEVVRVGPVEGFPGQTIVTYSRDILRSGFIDTRRINDRDLAEEPRLIRKVDCDKKEDADFTREWFKDSKSFVELIKGEDLPLRQKALGEAQEKKDGAAEPAETETTAPGTTAAPSPGVVPDNKPAPAKQTDAAVVPPISVKNEPVATVPQPQVPIESPAPQSEHRIGVYAVAAVVLILLLVGGVWIATKRKRT